MPWGPVWRQGRSHGRTASRSQNGRRSKMRRLRGLPAIGTKDRAKLEAMRGVGPPPGATQAELQKIDGNGGRGGGEPKKKGGGFYAAFRGGTFRFSAPAPPRRYWIEFPTKGKFAA